MKAEDINRVIALSQGWQWKYSRAKGELRWVHKFSPIDSYLQPPNYHGDKNQMDAVLSELSNEDLTYVISLDENLAVAYVKFLSEKP